MNTKMTKRGQVSIPAEIRKKLQIGPNTRLEWVIEENAARLFLYLRTPSRLFAVRVSKAWFKRFSKREKMTG
jgi:AbrB family looped-hinge helix DNA binding protein